MSKTMSPMQASTFEKVCELNRDNYGTPDFWIITDGHEVTICQQKNGEDATAKVSVPRSEFNKLIRWYTRPQKLRRR